MKVVKVDSGFIVWASRTDPNDAATPRSTVFNRYSDARQQTRDYTARSGYSCHARHSHDDVVEHAQQSDNQTTTNTGSQPIKRIFGLLTTKASHAEFPFADVTVDWSGFERIGFMSKATRAVSLNSGLSSKIKDDWQINSDNITTSTYNRQWSPLVGLNVTWLNDMDTQIRINAANSLTKSQSQGNTQRSSSRGANATVSYTMRTGFRLPILWFGAMRLQNQTTLSLNVDYQTNKQERSQSGSQVGRRNAMKSRGPCSRV